jgi:hypothetical protein
LVCRLLAGRGRMAASFQRLDADDARVFAEDG